MKKIIFLLLTAVAFTLTSFDQATAQGPGTAFGGTTWYSRTTPTSVASFPGFNTAKDIVVDTSHSGRTFKWASGGFRQNNKVNGNQYCKRYVCRLTQTSTGYPQQTVLLNQFSSTATDTIAWVRDSVGSYKGTLTGVFTANKTTKFTEMVDPAAGTALFGRSTGTGTYILSQDTVGAGRVDGFSTILTILVYD
jgi:hypothetical protein